MDTTFTVILNILLASLSAVMVSIYSVLLAQTCRNLEQGRYKEKSFDEVRVRSNAQLIFCGIFTLWSASPFVITVSDLFSTRMDTVTVLISLVTTATISLGFFTMVRSAWLLGHSEVPAV